MGFMSSILGSPSKSSSKTKPDTVWTGQQPYLQNMYAAGQNLMNEQLYGPQTFDEAGYNAALANWQRGAGGTTAGGGTASGGAYVPPDGKQFYSQDDINHGILPPPGSITTQGPYGLTVLSPGRAGSTGGPGSPMPTRDQFMKSAGGQSQFQKQLSALNDAWMQQLAGPSNPYLTGMASAAMNQISKQFQEQIMPSLLGGGNAAGQLGGARYAQLQNSAAAAAQKEMGDVAQNIYGQAWQSGLDAQGKAIAMGEGVMGAGWLPLMQQGTLLGRPTVLGGGGSSKTTGESGGLLGTVSKAAEAYKTYSGM